MTSGWIGTALFRTGNVLLVLGLAGMALALIGRLSGVIDQPGYVYMPWILLLVVAGYVGRSVGRSFRNKEG